MKCLNEDAAEKLNVLGNKNTSRTLSFSAASSSKHSQNIENGFPNMEKGPPKCQKLMQHMKIMRSEPGGVSNREI